jgi:phosphoglucomutase/phosphopentomutase
MVTASHNPAADNGFKVYWSNGAQIVEPHDKGIARCIAANLVPWDGVREAVATPELCALMRASPHVSDPVDEIKRVYFETIGRELCYARAEPRTLPIVFTAMHGVGKEWVRLAFEAFGLPPYVPVLEQVRQSSCCVTFASPLSLTPHSPQIEPDADFPTVAFPNPEEGRGALKLSIETAQRVGSPVIIANGEISLLSFSLSLSLSLAHAHAVRTRVRSRFGSTCRG